MKKNMTILYKSSVVSIGFNNRVIYIKKILCYPINRKRVKSCEPKGKIRHYIDR